MFIRVLHWRTILLIFATAIVGASIFLSNYLAKKIAREEKQKIEQWVAAVNEVNNINSNPSILSSKVLSENNKDIPMIAVTEKDSILDHYNLDSILLKNNSDYLPTKLEEFKKLNPPVIWKNPYNNAQNNLVYYGESALTKQIRYFPIVQLLVVTLFIMVVLYAITARNKSTQNQVWAGMAKETAHQLGTPLSSLQGWVEMLKEDANTSTIGTEMSKDIERLVLVSDRFGKIGSIPQLEETNIVPQINAMVQYIKRRASNRVNFEVLNNDEEIIAMVNAPLFDWVIENLLKNALDAMEGAGKIIISIKNAVAEVTIDVEDTGKGIQQKNLKNVFKPGFTTKKRGWGLGLSLSKRIIDQYHGGNLIVKQSELGKGTTFRIILKK